MSYPDFQVDALMGKFVAPTRLIMLRKFFKVMPKQNFLCNIS